MPAYDGPCEGSACRESLRRGRTHTAATLQPPVQGGTVAALAFVPSTPSPTRGLPPDLLAHRTAGANARTGLAGVFAWSDGGWVLGRA